MKNKRMSVKVIMSMALTICLVLSLNTMSVFADTPSTPITTPNDQVTEPIFNVDNITPIVAEPTNTTPNENENVDTGEFSADAVTNVAELTIYASSSSTGSSYSTDGHAYISIKNISSSNIQIGLLSGIAPNKTISIGTWGNKSEHTGIWYNLEEYFTDSLGAYTNNASLTMQITASQLTTINNYIINNDTWTIPNNCSVFASNLWNSINSVWFIGGTPTYLRTQIVSRSGSVIGKALPYDYLVYYAQGSNAPKRSTEF